VGRRFVALEVGRFALAGVVALVIVGVATAIASRRVGEREAIANARTTTVTKAEGLVAPALSDGVLERSPTALAAVDDVVRDDVLDASLVRVKLWNADGTIVYSDEFGSSVPATHSAVTNRRPSPPARSTPR